MRGQANFPPEWTFLCVGVQVSHLISYCCCQVSPSLSCSSLIRLEAAIAGRKHCSRKCLSDAVGLEGFLCQSNIYLTVERKKNCCLEPLLLPVTIESCPEWEIWSSLFCFAITSGQLHTTFSPRLNTPAQNFLWMFSEKKKKKVKLGWSHDAKVHHGSPRPRSSVEWWHHS